MKLQMKDASPEVIKISLITAICLVGDSMLYIALPIFWNEVGLDSLWQVGILLSINRFIRLPSNPIIGWIYKRISLKTGLLIAVSLGALTTLGYGIVSGFLGWLILRSLWGIAWSFFRIGGLATVTTYSTDGNVGKTMGLYNGLYRLGSLVGMLVGGILTPIIGLKNVSLLLGAFSLLAFIYLFASFRVKDTNKQSASVNQTTRFSIVRILRGSYLLFISSFFISLLFQGIITSTLSPLIGYLYEDSIFFIGMIVSVTALSGLLQAARWVWEPFLASWIGSISDGVKGRLPIYVGSLLFSSITVALLPFSVSIYIWVFVCLLVLISATSLTTLTDAIASDEAKKTDSVTFFTGYTIVQDVGAAMGPFLSYLVITLPFGFPVLFVSSSVLLLMFAVFWFMHSKTQTIAKTKTQSM
ncbi:MFS transporter [Fredinandcohnia humi]